MNNYSKKSIYVSLQLFIMCMFVLFAGTSCSQENEIRNVAKNYLKALVDYRLDDAKKYGDESAIQFLEGQQSIIDSWTPGQREEARKNLENIEVKITGVDIKDTKATVKYELIKNGKILQSENLYLLNNSTGWKVYESL